MSTGNKVIGGLIALLVIAGAFFAVWYFTKPDMATLPVSGNTNTPTGGNVNTNTNTGGNESNQNTPNPVEPLILNGNQITPGMKLAAVNPVHVYSDPIGNTQTIQFVNSYPTGSYLGTVLEKNAGWLKLQNWQNPPQNGSINVYTFYVPVIGKQYKVIS